MYVCVKSNTNLWSELLASGNLAHLKTTQSVENAVGECIEEYREVISKLLKDFD